MLIRIHLQLGTSTMITLNLFKDPCRLFESSESGRARFGEVARRYVAILFVKFSPSFFSR